MPRLCLLRTTDYVSFSNPSFKFSFTHYTVVNIETGLCTFSFQKYFFDILPIECVNHKYWIHHAGNLARLQEILLVDKIRPHWYATLQINFLRGSKVYLMVGSPQYKKLLISKGLCTTQACYTLQLDPRYHTYFIWDLNVIGMDFLFWNLKIAPFSCRPLLVVRKEAHQVPQASKWPSLEFVLMISTLSSFWSSSSPDSPKQPLWWAEP